MALHAENRARLVAACNPQCRLEWSRIDDEQQISSFCKRAVSECDFGNIARHARTNIDRSDRLEAADIVIPIDDRLNERRRHGDRRHAATWAARRRTILLRTATCQYQCGRNQSCQAHQTAFSQDSRHPSYCAVQRPALACGSNIPRHLTAIGMSETQPCDALERCECLAPENRRPRLTGTNVQYHGRLEAKLPFRLRPLSSHCDAAALRQCGVFRHPCPCACSRFGRGALPLLGWASEINSDRLKTLAGDSVRLRPGVESGHGIY